MIDRIPKLANRRQRKPPRPTRETPRTQFLLPTTRAGWLKAMGIALGAVLAVGAALVGLHRIGANGCSEFTTERTTVAAEGFQIRVMPSDLTGSFGVKLGVLSLADFTAAPRDAELQAAAASLPSGLTLVRDPIRVTTCSAAPRLATLRMSIPPEVEADASLDLYGWDSRARTWAWLGGELDAASRSVVAQVSRVPSLVALMKVAPMPPSLGIELPPATRDPTAIVRSSPPGAQIVYAAGLYLGDRSSIVGDPGRLLRPSDAPRRVIPAVRNWGAQGEVNRTLLRTMLASQASRTAHVKALLSLVEVGGFEGVQIDYRGVEATQRDAFSQLIEQLGARLAERGKTLHVAIPAPALTDSSGVFDSSGYDLHRIGQAAAWVQLDLSTNPEVWYTDRLDPLMAWAVGRVDRRKLQVILPTLGVQKDANGRVRLIGLEEALAGLGGLRTVAPAVAPGASVRVWWSGDVEPADVRYDPIGQVYAYSTVDERGIQQTVWLSTAASLKRALERLSRHNIRGVTLRGWMHPGNDDGVMQIVDGFARGDLASVQVPEPVLKVAFGAGTPFSFPLGQSPDAMIVQAPGGEGQYEIASVFQSARAIALNPMRVLISRDAPAAEGDAEAASVASQDVAPPMPGMNAERFELGGHVNNLVHAAQMKTAGMTWARTEVRGEALPEAFIAEAKAKGLKVLVTAIGDRNRVMDVAYRDQWAQHLGKIAAAGADAIEVWSEPNYQAEWPAGQISGASYADLLKRAYFAIKQANPGTLVISAGLAQTSGVFAGGCAEDGCDELAFLNQMAAEQAQNYMDCVGIHYTSGFQSPGTVGPLHYSQYYEPLRNAHYGAFNGAKPVCFTALGYVTAEGFPSGMPAKYSFAAGTTLADHSAWLAEAAKRSKASGKVRLMIVWNVDATEWIADDPSRNIEGDPQAGYAMIRPDGTCPACEALRSVMK